MTTEYIAKIKGDTTALEAAISKAEGRIQRLNDDEVIIILNYDGNIKEFYIHISSYSFRDNDSACFRRRGCGHFLGTA